MSAQAERIQTGRLREDPVSKLLLQFSFPAIMAMPVPALYNMVDRIFIGNYPPTGANGLAAIAVSFPFLLVLLAFGLLIGVGGARLIRRVKKTVLLAAAAATVWSLFSFVFTTFFPEPVIRLFTREEALIRFGSKALRIVFVTIPIVGFQIVISNYFQAVGKPMKAVFLTLSRQILTLIPAIIGFGALWGVEGILWTFPFSEVIAATLSAVAIAFEWQRLDRLEKKF